VLLFDWGNTLMVDFGSAGPMAHWPKVAAVAGVGQALRALRPRHRLVVATNAADSGAVLVLAALARVGLDVYVERVFSSCEIGAEKPDPAFFRALLAELVCPPAEAVMIGDSYDNDVRGAKAQGLRTVWFNEGGRLPALPAPAPATPATPLAHDVEIHSMAELPEAVASLERLGKEEA
jgi:putative hydrolase of the HAD superfamily